MEENVSRVAVVTDTNSGISPEEAERIGVTLIPMPFTVDGEEYFEGVTCTYEHFFEMLAAGGDVSTSQPSPYAVTSVWKKLLEEYDEVVHIPMSSALSSSCSTAKALAAEFEGRVCVSDNKRISVTQRTAVLDALCLARQGKTAAEIVGWLENDSYNCSIYLAVNTLELLKKSGRVTAAGAALATILGLKPVLQIQGEKLDAFAKVRGMANAEKTMLEALKKDLEVRFAGKKMHLYIAYTGDLAPAQEWQRKAMDYFNTEDIEMYKLPISVSCHVGAGVKAIGCAPLLED